MTPRRDARRAGMTLIELLVSMALLASLGALVVQLMRNSFELYAAGERRGEFAANAMTVLTRLDDDLRNVATTREGRFLLERRGTTGVGAPALLLRLIRTAPQGEARHPSLRASGSTPGAAGVFVGRDPAPESRRSLAPAANLIEVCYALIQDPSIDAGVLTLYRGERAPAFAAGATFFDPENTEPDDAWVRERLSPIATGVLALHLLCRGPLTEDWNEENVLESGGGAGGATAEWDSTRGTLPVERFPFALGEASLGEPRDDLFPSHVRAVLVMGRPGRPDAKLGRRLMPGSTELTVDRAERLPRAQDEERFVKLGHEWLEVKANESWGATVARGRRRTNPSVDYETSVPVYAGKTFRRTVELPRSGAPSKDPVR
jgi:prepilin-type N-terminal cleavage/methylation domain-containing protein